MVERIIQDLGYVGVALAMLAENLFPPIPSEAILPLAGFLVAQGDFSFFGMLLASTVGSVVGASILYECGRRGGRPLVLRYGRLLRLEATDLDRAEKWFGRYGSAVVLGARMVPLARSIVSVPAGTLRMGRLKFTALTAVGSALWNTLLIGAGWFLGNEWDRIQGPVSAASKVLLIAVSLGLIAGGWLLIRRRRTASRESE